LGESAEIYKVEGEINDAREKVLKKKEGAKSAEKCVIDEKEKLETEAKVKLYQFFGDQ
jgi:hypothetical protein